MGSLAGSWFFCFLKTLTAAGKAARRGEATIYRGISTAADGFARRGKPKTPTAVKVSVVVRRHQRPTSEPRRMKNVSLGVYVLWAVQL